MNTRRSTHVIVGAALIGAVYGVISVMQVEGQSASLWNVSMSGIGGLLICGSAASALVRIRHCFRVLQEAANCPREHQLCYRGIRHDPKSIVEPQNVSEHVEIRPDLELAVVRRFDDNGKPVTIRMKQLSLDQLSQLLSEFLDESEFMGADAVTAEMALSDVETNPSLR